MKTVSRRDLIKTGLMAPAAVAAAQGMGPFTSGTESIAQETRSAPARPPDHSPVIGAGRERLLLDFGWRFHLGNADKQSADFNLGAGGQTFAKSGNLAGNVRPAAANFDDSCRAARARPAI